MMYSMKKRLLSGLLTVVIAMGCVMPVFAADNPVSTQNAQESQTAIAEESVAETAALEVAANAATERLTNRTVQFYAYIDNALTLVESKSNVTTYWIENRQCIDTATLESVYGKLGFKAADLTAGGKLFLHTDWNDATIWAEPAKAADGEIYAAAINHKETSAANAPGDKFDVFYLPKHSVNNNTNKANTQTIAAETFYTVTSPDGTKQYFLKGRDAVIELDASTQNWTCTGKDGKNVAGVTSDGKITFTIPAIAQPYTLAATEKPEPKPVVLTAKVNGTEFASASLADIIALSNIPAKEVTRLEFVSGELTKADRDFIKSDLRWMTDMTLNVSETMKLLDDNGQPTTVLGTGVATFDFKNKPDGWSKGALTTLTLSGITEVREGAIKSDSVETIDLPDVVTVGASSLSGFQWLKTLNLPKAKTIGEYAFHMDRELRNLTLNAVETLEEGSFAYTDNLRKLTLPETIKTIGNIKFGIVRSGNKSGTVITINAATPPTTDGRAFQNVNGGVVVVPQGALETYVHQSRPNADTSKFLDKNEAMWKELWLREDESHTIKFYNTKESWNVKFAYVKEGATVRAEQIPTTTIPEGKMLKGWNTKRDGTGVWVNEQMKPSELPRYPSEPDSRYPFYKEIEVYPIFADAVALVAKVNGTTVEGASLKALIARPGVAAEDVTHLEFVSGELTKADRDFIKSDLRWMTDMTLNVSETMKLLDDNGQPTTVLGTGVATFDFKNKPDGWSKGALTTLTLSGITEVREGAIKSDSVETIDLPDVVTVGASSLSGFQWLKTLNLPKAKTIGEYAFHMDRELRNLTLNAVETLEEGSFAYTDNLRKLTLPETIKTIGNIKFGIVRSGNKSGTVITIKAATPPTVNRNAFEGVNSNADRLSGQSVVVVPQGALEAYMHQSRPNADVSKVLSRYDVQWNGLYLREEGSHTIMYYYPGKTYNNQYAYVKDGSALTDAQIPVVNEEANQLFLGWNTEKNGTGDRLSAEFVPSSEVTAYPVLVPAVTITVDLGDSTETIKVEQNKPIGDKLPAAPEKDENHDFAGWFDENGNPVTGDTVAKNDMTIHPTWFEDFNHNDIDDATEPHYTVIYSDAGLHPGDPVFEAQVHENILTGMPTPAFGDDPAREGEVFAGWDPVVSNTVTSDIIYNAVWYKDENNNGIADKDEAHFCVTYTDGADGSVFGNRVFSDLLTDTKTPAFPGTTDREGYIFAGWTPDVADVVTDNAVYTAVWKEDRNHNGIADDEDTYHDVVFTDGVNGEVFADVHFSVLTGTTIPSFGADPVREGYVFKGWKDQNGNAVTADTVVTGDLTVSAVFEKEADPVKPVEPTEPESTKPTEPKPTNPEPTNPQPTKPTEPKPVKPATPATGDTANPMGWMFLIAVAATGAALSLRKRREQN